MPNKPIGNRNSVAKCCCCKAPAFTTMSTEFVVIKKYCTHSRLKEMYTHVPMIQYRRELMMLPLCLIYITIQYNTINIKLLVYYIIHNNQFN